MSPFNRPTVRLALVCLAFLGSLLGTSLAGAKGTGVTSHTLEVNGTKIQYLAAGEGPPLILLHGYTQTSHMWEPIIPELAKKFRVIAPDLPGIGGSSIPEGGMDMKAAAVLIHGLAQSLGISKARLVGHDIGLMVAYAYAAMYPAETEKLAVMDAFLPGVEGGDAIYNNPAMWHFRFSGPTPEALVKGRERVYFEHYWNNFAADKNHSIPEVDRQIYTEAYSRSGRIRAGWAYFISFPQTAKDFTQLSQTKLTMPILSIGGERSLGTALGEQMKRVGTDVTVIVLKNTGHWVLEENFPATSEALLKFL